MTVLFIKQRSNVSKTHFGGLRGNVCDSSLGRWNAGSRVPTCNNWTFLLALIRLRRYEQTYVQIGLGGGRSL